MASSEPAHFPGLEKIRQDYLECCICKEEYTDPKLLDCLHSFCRNCLKEYHNTNLKNAKMIICPLCRQETQLPETGVQDLKTNLILTRLALQLEQISSTEKTKLICEQCEEGSEATFCCFDCPMIICANCNNMHQKMPSLSSHTVATFKDVLDGKIAKKEERVKRHPECQTHEGEVMCFYCTTCDVLICQACTVIDHCKPQHEYIDCNQASSTYKQSLAQLMTPLEESVKTLEKSQATISTLKDNLDITVERTMAEVKNRADEIRAEVTAQESRIMDEIKSFRKDRNWKLEEYEHAVSVNLQPMQQSLQKAKDVSNNSSAPDFLALYPTISKDLKLPRHQKQPQIDSTLDQLRFVPDDCDISLGNLEAGWKLFSRISTRSFFIDASLLGDSLVFIDYFDRVAISNMNGYGGQTIELSHAPVAVAAFQDRIVVVDKSNCVKMYDKNGTKRFSFYTLPQREVGKTEVELRSVAFKDKIIVGDVERRVITTHSSSDGSLIDTVSVRTYPYYLAIDSKDRVVVSSGNYEVYIVDGNGTIQITIKPTINGDQVRYCRGICCHNSFIYITVLKWEFNNGHIHRYDTEGRFLSCTLQGLFFPFDVSLTSDGQHLLIIDDRAVKIYKKCNVV